jgi:protein involved in polysaccharide export with SLBB domain
MKKITVLIFFVFFSTLSAQGGANVVQYYQQLKAQGFTDQQIQDLAKQNGYDTNNLFSAQKKSSTIAREVESAENIESSFTSAPKSENLLAENSKLQIFGSQYFKDIDYNFSPQINIATPLDYQLGPGDNIDISLWGASEVNYQQKINRQGNIIIDGVGPIYLNGYSIGAAKARLKKELSKIYKGLYSNTVNEKINIDLTLDSTRSVFVNIVGQVNTPGLYTLNGMSSPIHALYAAGGISNNGSYRTIEIVRRGKVISTIDLYNYFTSGILQTIFLKDQDVIRVPYYNNRVELSGEVKFQGIFELLPNETLEDLVNYSGGLSPMALKETFLLSRIDNSSFKSKNINSLSESLISGDKVYVYAISEEKNNAVSIEGEILVPGTYSLENISTVRELINASKGYTQNAYLEYGTLYRNQPNGVDKMLSVGLISSKYNLNLDEPLKESDRLVIYKKDQFLPFEKIKIIGEVNNPGTYNFYSGMSLQDLIALAEGVGSNKEKLKIIVKSKDEISNDFVLTTSLDQFNLETFSSLTLKPNDVVSVVLKNNFQSSSIKLSGEVFNPGYYVQSKASNSIKELIENAGGLTQFASENSIYIQRKNIDSGINEIVNDSLINETDDGNDLIYIPIENLNQNYFFQDRDEIVIDSKSDDVTLSGEVLKPSIVKYKSKKLKYYLSKSAINSSGSKKNILVIYPNKDVSSTKSFLFFKKYPTITPGSEIIVSKRPERAKISSQELIGITSGLSTLIIVLSTFLSSP